MATDFQAHGGSVNTSSTPKVEYDHADGSDNTTRPTRIVYPNGRVLHIDYGPANGINDSLSRVAALVDDDGTTVLAGYSYLGLNGFVETDYTEPEIKNTLIDLTGTNDPDTGDIYSGLDRFGRVKDCRWRNYGNNTDSARIQYGYDRASNRTWRHDPVAASFSAQFDELYSYDALHRLKEMQRGTLNGPKTGLTAESFAQCWTLDSTGNWKGFREDDTGNGTWDLIQSRTANPVNEIIGISETAGPSWATPAYDAAGNMTTVPQPNAPTESYTATYDAWNRMVKVVDATTTDMIAEYTYDARNFRILQQEYTDGAFTQIRHFFYSQNWQVIEERLDSETTADRQFVWGERYIDDIILRDVNAIRLYGMQDANWNIMALADALGDIQERFAYSAYGIPLFLDATYSLQPASAFQWDTLYAGYRHDHATGLYPVRYRYLQSLLGCWLTRDPADELINHGYSSADIVYENPLEYVRSNPIRYIDPMGLYAIDSISASIRQCLLKPTYAAQMACLDALLGINPRKVAIEAAMCAVIHAEYSSLNCQNCNTLDNNKPADRKKAAERVLCITAEIALRKRYVNMKCDYKLPGSIKSKEGSAQKEKGHKRKILHLSTDLAFCTVAAVTVHGLGIGLS